MDKQNHFTTRRRFIAAMGFGGVGLYGLWAAYGVAPGPLELFDLHAEHDDGGQGGGAHAAIPGGPDVDEFRRLTAEFIGRFRQPDGSVYPREKPAGSNALGPPVPNAAHPAATAATAHAAHDAHGAETAATAATAPAPRADTHAAHGGALDVYMMAGQWFYEPALLRLDAGRDYRLRMMAADVAHGASIQFGRGARMVRLRPGRVTELSLAFHRPGEYLVHCTVYCGLAHDYMQARIVVV